MTRTLPLLLLAYLAGSPAFASALTHAQLEAMTTFSRSKGGQILLVCEKGRVRLEHYKDRRTGTEPQNLMSGAKNFWAVAILMAREDGILDLDEKVAGTLKEWAPDPQKAAIRVRDLLQCASGLDPTIMNLPEPARTDKYAASLLVPSLAPAGMEFAYGTTPYLVLGEFLKRRLAAGGERLPDYLKRRLMGPLGLGLDTWKTDPAGNLITYAGLSLTPREWLAFGQMLLQKGRYGGAQMVSQEALAQAFQPSSANSVYGLSFWLNAHAGPGVAEADVERWIAADPGTVNWKEACLCRNAPRDLVACIGSYGQRLYVVPSRQMIIVHLGKCSHFIDSDFLNQVFPIPGDTRPAHGSRLKPSRTSPKR
jgi:CubicO group peptidase (beta-lactamase class C family)